MLVFLFSLLILLYIFFFYPLILLIVSGICGKVVNKQDFYPTVSLIISAYNEEKVIKQKIENALKLDYPKEKLEIIVASESTDQTNEIVRRFQGQGIQLHAYDKREGKRATLYRTVPLATGEIIVFSDANAIYTSEALIKLTRNFSDLRIGCVSGRLKYVASQNSFIGAGESAYWEFDLLLKRLASRLFSLGGCGGVNGSIFALRKECYKPFDKYRGDDFELSCRVEINGYGVVLEMEAISFEEVSETSSQEFTRKVRLASWNIVSCLMLLKEAIKYRRYLTAFLLVSHRLIRYTIPLWLILLFTSNIFLLNHSLRYLFCLQLIFYALALLGLIMEKIDHKPNLFFLLPFYFCMVSCAALFALIKTAFSKTEGLWEKTR